MKKIYCSVNGWDCPYWRKDGTCSMEKEEGVHPKEECDDYAFFDAMFDGLDEEWKMRLSELIDKIYNMGGNLNSDIEIKDTDGNTLLLENCSFEADLYYHNTITINTGNY